MDDYPHNSRPTMLANWMYLFLNFFMGTIYFSVFISLLSLGLGLAVILIGIPILYGTLVAMAWTTLFDRRFNAALFADPETLAAVNAQPRTTLMGGFGYILGKFITGTLSIVALSLLVPLFVLEIILMLVGMNTRQFTAHLTHAIANALMGLQFAGGPASKSLRTVEVPDGEISRHEKAKHKLKNDDLVDFQFYDDEDDESGEIVYYIGDDGEIMTRRRR